MLSESRKLRLIEHVLKIQNDSTLDALEDFLKTSTKQANHNQNAFLIENFSGIWERNEADEFEKIIEESFESINPDDWK